jgi:hypothetical protein
MAIATSGVSLEDCEAQLYRPSPTPSTGVDFTDEENDPHSPARLSEWETSLIVMAIGALVRNWWPCARH